MNMKEIKIAQNSKEVLTLSLRCVTVSLKMLWRSGVSLWHCSQKNQAA